MRYAVACILSLVLVVKAAEEREKRNVGFEGFGPGGFAGGPGCPGAPNCGPVATIIQEPAVSVVASSVTVQKGNCPGGDSIGKPCDAKRPWPQCPPQSYCYAVNTVDIGPYYCCPVWSTYGAQWRPAAPFYPYYPPMPYNWPYIVQATANWGAQTSPFAGWAGQFGPLLELLQAKATKQRQASTNQESKPVETKQ